MIKTLVIHAKPLTERLHHMEQQLKGLPMETEYILDGDKDELTQDVIDAYLKKDCEIYKVSGATSCAIKHFMACQYIVEHGLEGALVLEDDIVLHKGFEHDFGQMLAELNHCHADKPVIISLEDSSLQFIPRSKRKKGQWLYEAPHGRVRFTGALYINQKAAKVITDDVAANRCDYAVDHYYVHLYEKGLLDFLWCEPALATQGSFNGTLTSSIGRVRSFEGLRWRFKYAYKRFVYWLR